MAIISNEIQYYLRILSVFIGVLLNAKWYRANYPEHRGIFLLVIIALVMGLYINEV